MKIYSILILALISILFQYSSCKSGGKCEEPFDVRNSYMLLTFKNSLGEYLYRETNPTYNKDSLKIYDETGNRMSVLSQLDQIPNSTSSYWKFDLGNLYNSQTDLEAFNKEICKKYIIKYSYNETDTIMACYKIATFKCGSEFDPLKVYHKGILLKEENSGVISISVIITKI